MSFIRHRRATSPNKFECRNVCTIKSVALAYISRAAAEEALEPLTQQPMTPAEVNHARRQHNLPLDSGAETEQPAQPKQEPMNFRITDDDLGAGGPKTKYKANVEAIRVLQTLDAEQRQATAEEQEILSRYVGWGGIPQAFDENNAEWSKEYAELQSLLTTDEYKEARASTLNAFYTSPTVIKAMYEALGNMGLSKGNVLEPSCGVGNFMGLVPDSMEKIRMYGVELDSISGRIAQQLYQKNKIAVQGFETMQFPDSFFAQQLKENYNMIDGCVNNVPKKPRRIGGRWSVLDRLHIKQAERRQKDNAPQQEQERSRKS